MLDRAEHDTPSGVEHASDVGPGQTLGPGGEEVLVDQARPVLASGPWHRPVDRDTDDELWSKILKRIDCFSPKKKRLIRRELGLETKKAAKPKKDC